MSAYRLDVPAKRGSILNGILFREGEGRSADTVMIAITGIHGNFYSNPFYYNFGETLNSGGIDFIYAQTNDAFNRIETFNAKTGSPEIIGLYNEYFSYTDEDIDAYIDFAIKESHVNVILAGHSLGANKVTYYLSRHHDTQRVSHFLLLSPANLEWLMNGVTEREKNIVRSMHDNGPGKLCMAMGITTRNYGADLCGDELYIVDDGREYSVMTSERVNIDYAEECRHYLWRYYAEGNIYVSKVKKRVAS